jgi:adenosylcobyric acid synthase
MPAVMIQGCGSNVGKSMLVAGLCRAARGAGLSLRRSSRKTCPTMPPSPPMVARSGVRRPCRPLLAGLEPMTDMNPVLLKPES